VDELFLNIQGKREQAVSGSFPALKPSTTTISLRLPASLLE
jgi:hypothetical protein